MPIIPTVYSRWFTPEWSWVPFLWSDMISKSGATAEIKSTKYPQRWFLVDQTWDKPWYSYIFSAFRVRNLFRIFGLVALWKTAQPVPQKSKKPRSISATASPTWRIVTVFLETLKILMGQAAQILRFFCFIYEKKRAIWCGNLDGVPSVPHEFLC